MDEYAELSDNESKSIMTLLKSEQCRFNSTPYTLLDFVFQLRQHEKEHCRLKILEAIRKLEVEAILYYFNGNSKTLAHCHGWMESVNIISLDSLDERRIAFYSNSMRLRATQQTPFIFKVYQEKRDNFPDNWKRDIVKSLYDDVIPSDSEYEEWKENNLFGCGKRWPERKK